MPNSIKFMNLEKGKTYNIRSLSNNYVFPKHFKDDFKKEFQNVYYDQDSKGQWDKYGPPPETSEDIRYREREVAERRVTLENLEWKLRHKSDKLEEKEKELKVKEKEIADEIKKIEEEKKRLEQTSKDLKKKEDELNKKEFEKTDLYEIMG